MLVIRHAVESNPSRDQVVIKELPICEFRVLGQKLIPGRSLMFRFATGAEEGCSEPIQFRGSQPRVK